MRHALLIAVLAFAVPALVNGFGSASASNAAHAEGSPREDATASGAPSPAVTATLPPVVVSATASPPPGTTRALALTSGATVVPLDLSLDLRLTPVTPFRKEPSRHRLVWREIEGVQVGTASGPGWEATLRLEPEDGAAALDVELRYDHAMEVEHEALRIRLHGRAHAVNRLLAVAPVDGVQRVDRGTPIFVATTSLALSAGPGFAAARYVPGRWRGGSWVDADLILDDVASHPFGTYEQCLEKLPADENDPNAPVNWTELEKKTPHDRIVREAGTVVHAHASISLPDAGVGAAETPLIVERWAKGAKAAFVLTDHADRTDPVALRAILYGTSDTKSADYGKKGFFGRGLSLTKTFFAHGSIHGTLNADAGARAAADEIVARGSEVGAHSITPLADLRESVRKALPDFDRWHVVTWIDHEPYTNCEALSNLGWKTEAPYGLRDLLVDHGYRWVWAASDLPGPKESRVANLFGGAPALAEPVFYPFPPDPRLWLFRSVWFYAPPARLAKSLDDKSLDALEASRGLFVGHTYLSASLATTKSDAHKADLAVHKNEKTGSLEIDAKLDEALARLAARQDAGRLVTLSWRNAGDRLRALGDVEVSYREDGSAVVENHGAADIADLTVSVPAPDLELSATDDADVKHAEQAAPTRHEPERSTTWFDLRAGARSVVRASRNGTPFPLLPIRRVTLQPR